MSTSIKNKLLPLIILSTLFILLLGTACSAAITVEFKSMGKSYQKTEQEWMALTEPTVIEVDEHDGSWYIIWAITEDKEKINDVYYESTGFYIHTEPTNTYKKGNTSNNRDKEKLRKNYNRYGDMQFGGNAIRIDKGSAATSEKVTLPNANPKTRWYRMIKLQNNSTGLKKLFGSEGYQPGDKLYFSDIMQNHLPSSYSPRVKGELTTYLLWSSDYMHNLVFDYTRVLGGEFKSSHFKYKTIEYYTADSNGNKIMKTYTHNILKDGDFVDAFSDRYIAIIQGHYDREIKIDETIEIVKEYNATLNIWKNDLDDDGNLIGYKMDGARTLTFTQLKDGTSLTATDDKKKVIFTNLSAATNNKLEARSPVVEKYTYKEAKVDKTTNYELGSEVKINGKDIVIDLYYEQESEPVENKIYVYKVKKDTGRDFTTQSNQLATPIERIGDPGASKTEVIQQIITANSQEYKFYNVKYYHGDNKVELGYTSSYPTVYTYQVSSTPGQDTHVVIEYFTVVDDPDEEHYVEPYTDQSLDGSARGHILSDKLNNSTGREYNVLNGIPTSQAVYSFAQANGFLYKVEGNRRYGKKNFDVITYEFYTYTDSEGNKWYDIRYDDSSYPEEQGVYEYYTIEKYDIAKLSGARIEHAILDPEGVNGVNSWDSTSTLNVDPKIASSTEYLNHAQIKNDDEFDLDENIEMYNSINRDLANEINAKREEEAAKKAEETGEEYVEPEKVAAPQISYLNGSKTTKGTKDTTVIYVLLTKDSTAEDVSEDAQKAIKNQVSYSSDRIDIEFNDGTGKKECQINPQGELTYLTYDPVGDLDLDDLQGSYEDLEGNFWDKWRGSFLGDIAAGFFDILDGAVNAIQNACNKIIEKYQDRDTLKERLEGVDLFDIPQRWDIFIQWWREEKMKEMQEAIDEYNKEAKSINEIPRAVPKESFTNTDPIFIDHELPNGIYSSPEDSCKVQYERISTPTADDGAAEFTALIEDSYMMQLMYGIYALPDESSYQEHKTRLLPVGQPDIGWELAEAFEEVYTAAEFVYDLEYIVPGEVNDVIVHTPVVVSAKLKPLSSNNETQYMGATGEIVDGLTVEYVKIGEEYTLELTCKGVHRPIIGYSQDEYNLLDIDKETDYSMFVKDNKIAIRFPYDIYVNADTNGDGTLDGYKLYKGNQWNNFLTNVGTVKIRIPEWAETEDNNGVANFDIRVSALNDMSSDTEEMGWIKANMDPGNVFRKIYTDNPKDYRANYSIPVKAIGKVYDFRVNYTDDPGYILTYTSGRMQEGQTGNKADGFLINNLPIGKVGTNTSNPTYQKAPKLGSKFKFNVKTLGWKTDNITITPTFYFVPKDGSTAYKVDVYYDSKNTGKTVKLTDACDFKLDTTLPKTTAKLTDGQIVTEPGPNSARVTSTNKVKDAYAYGQIYQFKPTYLDRVTSARTTNIGNLGKINLTEEERFRLPISNDLKQMASNSIWYGEYKLPSTSKFIRSTNGGGFKPENVLTKAKDGDGYILVCFAITGKYQGNSYLSYQKTIASEGSQWDVEGYTNQNVQLVNGGTYKLPGNSKGEIGVGVFLYEAFENNGKDVVNPH